jgi:hypothetical protein
MFLDHEGDPTPARLGYGADLARLAVSSFGRLGRWRCMVAAHAPWLQSTIATTIRINRGLWRKDLLLNNTRQWPKLVKHIEHSQAHYLS